VTSEVEGVLKHAKARCSAPIQHPPKDPPCMLVLDEVGHPRQRCRAWQTEPPLV
jgi:hypothetical protein